MTRAATDYTGIAYLAALAGLAGVAWYVQRNFVSLGDAVASARRTVADAAQTVADRARAVPTAVANTIADRLPSSAEQQVNAPGFWVNQGRLENGILPLRNIRPILPGEFGEEPFTPPATVKPTGNSIYTDSGPQYDPLGNVIN